MKSYLNLIMNPLTERMGDNKEGVRKEAVDVMLGIIRTLSPQWGCDRVVQMLSHKSWRVREQASAVPA